MLTRLQLLHLPTGKNNLQEPFGKEASYLRSARELIVIVLNMVSTFSTLRFFQTLKMIKQPFDENQYYLKIDHNNELHRNVDFNRRHIILWRGRK